jgi:uncharacterized protein YceH (UPF0502 family)
MLHFIDLPLPTSYSYDRRVRLSLEDGRVIACLIEKQLTTPQQYPLTLNSLVLACNQSSNRDPVVSYGDGQVQRSVASLKEAGLLRYVYPSHGRSVNRYQHVLDERLAMEPERLALLAVLILRGPQTSAELRARTERMASFDPIGDVEAELERMAALPEPLVERLGRRPGQKEERWAQLLTPPSEPAYQPRHVVADGGGGGGDAPGGGRPPSFDGGGTTDQRLRGLADELADLRAEVAALRLSIEDLKGELGVS